ncbi:MAG: hypothetical protein AAFR37_24460 [Cyanobacteria bacterium J06628_3]
MKKYISLIFIANVLLTGCNYYDMSFGTDVSKEQMSTWNKLSNHQENCINLIKDRDKFTDCYKTALENDASINLSIDSEVRRFYLNWECIQMESETEEQQEQVKACMDNVYKIVRKEFPGEGY